MAESDFGKTLRAYRAARGWSQTELAKKAGLSRQAISKLENSKATPRRTTVDRLKKALGVPLWVVGGGGGDIVQEAPPFTILPWPPRGITWEEVAIAVADYCAARARDMYARAKETRREGEGFYQAVEREAKRWSRIGSKERENLRGGGKR